MQGTARQIHSIATHPSQPDKCASGGSNGTVAVWDLRFTSAPLQANHGNQKAGDVWQVRYCGQICARCSMVRKHPCLVLAGGCVQRF